MELKDIINKLYIVDKALAKLLDNPDDNDSLYTMNVVLEDLRKDVSKFKGHVIVPDDLTYLVSHIIKAPIYKLNSSKNYGHGRDIVDYEYIKFVDNYIH